MLHKVLIPSVGVKGSWLGHTRGGVSPRGDSAGLRQALRYSSGVVDASKHNISHPRPSLHGEELQPMRGDLVCTEHSRSKGGNLEKNLQSYGVSAMPLG